jgi:hypothetical protein
MIRVLGYDLDLRRHVISHHKENIQIQRGEREIIEVFMILIPKKNIYIQV